MFLVIISSHWVDIVVVVSVVSILSINVTVDESVYGSSIWPSKTKGIAHETNFCCHPQPTCPIALSENGFLVLLSWLKCFLMIL